MRALKPLYHRLLVAGRWILILFLLCCGHAGRAQMRELSYDTLDAQNEIRGFSFLSASEGFAAFDHYLGYTTDSGRHFIQRPVTLSNVDYNGFSVNLTFGFGMGGVVAFSRDSLLLFGDYGFVPAILFSADGGLHYKLIFHSQYDPLNLRTGITDLVFPAGGAVGYAIDADRILKTTDRGQHWSVLLTDPGRYFDRISAPDSLHVYAYSIHLNSQGLIATSDAGNTWSSITLPSGQLNFASFLQPGKGFVRMQKADRSYAIYFSGSNGATWRLMNDTLAASAPSGSDVIWTNDSTAFALSGLFFSFKTSDSGKVWEQLPRDNDFSYLGYGHNRLYVHNDQQIWAGGGHGFLEMSTNGGGNPLPKALFRIDTTGLSGGASVQLLNFSKPTYQFQWFLNGSLVSTAYRYSYVHDMYRLQDTVRLIVSNGSRSDTLERIQYYYPPVLVTAFSPDSAASADQVEIRGLNFTDVRAVYFGGQPALAFTVVSDTLIRAQVGNGSSGTVRVFTGTGFGGKAGFVYIAAPLVNLPVSVSDSLLCKSEPVVVHIQQSEPGVLYEWLDSTGQVLGAVTGNGATVQLSTIPVSYSGNFRLRARKPGTSAQAVFSNIFHINTEHPVSQFVADRVNVLPGEPVRFRALSLEAVKFNWTFFEDASRASDTVAWPAAVRYSGSGAKSLQLISSTAQGCADTLKGTAVFVYDPATASPDCFAMTMDSSGHPNGQFIGGLISSPDDGYTVFGQSPPDGLLRSRTGLSRPMGNHWSSYMAKYTANGVLQWIEGFHIDDSNSAITALATDEAGNYYVAGYANSLQWFHFNNGDSLRLYGLPSDTIPVWDRKNGFLLKLDPAGNLIWYSLLFDQTQLYTGYPYTDAYITGLAVRNGRILAKGDFRAKMTYIKSGSRQVLYDMTNSVFADDNQNNFILGLDTAGNFHWKTYLHNSSVNYYSMGAPRLDANGNGYISGNYELQAVLFDADSTVAMALQGETGHEGAYLFKLDPSGHLSWFNNLRASYQYGDMKLADLRVNDQGESYATGLCFTAAIPGSISLLHSDGSTSYSDSLSGYALLKLDPAGHLRWTVGSRYAYAFGGGGLALAIDSSRVRVIGRLSAQEPSSTYDLSSTDGRTRQITIGNNELFAASYDTAGRYQRVLTSGNLMNDGPDDDLKMESNGRGDLYVAFNKRTYTGAAGAGSYFGIKAPDPFAAGGDAILLKLDTAFCNSLVVAQAGADRSICQGDTAILGVRASGDIYQWTSSPAGFSSSQPSPVIQPAQTTDYYLTVLNDYGVSARDTVRITVLSLPPAAAGPDTTICGFTDYTLGTDSVAGNSYSWTSKTATFSSTAATPRFRPTQNDIYYLAVRNANGCSAYDTVLVNVEYAEPIDAAVVVSTNQVCPNDKDHFVAYGSYLGAHPTYQWQRNGQNVGDNSSGYTDSNWVEGDRVRVIITSSDPCNIPSVDTSSEQIIHVLPVPVPQVAIYGDTVVNENDSVQVWITYTLPGNYPSFYWEDSTSTHDWARIPGTYLPSLWYHPQKTGDAVRCVYRSTVKCVADSAIRSEAKMFTVKVVVIPTAVGPEPARNYGVQAFPNPVTSDLYLKGLRLSDQWQTLSIVSANGQRPWLMKDIAGKTSLQLDLRTLPPGEYVCILYNRKGRAVYLRLLRLNP